MNVGSVSFHLLAIPGQGFPCHVPELSGQASARPNHLVCSTAGKHTSKASPSGSPTLCTPAPSLPLGEGPKQNRADALPRKPWGPAPTKRDLRAPRHHARVHTHTRMHTPLLSTHSDLPKDSHFRLCPRLLLVVWVYRPSVGSASQNISPNAAKCSLGLPIGEWYYTLLICFLVSLRSLNILSEHAYITFILRKSSSTIFESLL